MAARRRKVIIGALILLGIGALYAVFVKLTGRGIPCPINMATGLQCPGCGVSRMCLAILRFDFASAFRANAVLFCLLPVMAATAARLIYVYIRRGTLRDRAAEIAIWVMIAVLLVWGVVRNLI